MSVEGSTDEAFLWPIVYNTAVLLATSATIVDATAFIRRSSNEERAQTICHRSAEFDIFVVHADASNTALPRIRETIIDAVRDEVGRICGLAPYRIVGLITVREMESWALASPDSIALALGYEAWPPRVPVPWDPTQVEAIPDPKRVLISAIESLLSRFDSGNALQETLEAIAERLPLEKLRGLSSYRNFADELAQTLRHLRAGN